MKWYWIKDQAGKAVGRTNGEEFEWYIAQAGKFEKMFRQLFKDNPPNTNTKGFEVDMDAKF